MKIRVKEGSSIWKLATWWGTDNLPSNFCDLIQNVFWCFLVTFFFVAAASAWIACVIATLGASFSVEYVIWSIPLILFAVFVGFILFGIIFSITYDHFSAHPNQRLVSIKIAYRSWQDKYCPLVEEIK